MVGRLRDFDTDIRGSAHTVGYVLMIAIFLAGGISLFVVSITVFTDTNNNPTEDAVDQVQTLQSSFNSFVDGSPSREATLDGRDATLTYGEPVEVTVEARSINGNLSASRSGNVVCDGTWCKMGQRDVTPLVYQIDEGSVEYINGAVLLSQSDDAGIVRSKGAWRITDYARFPILATQQEPGTSGSVGVSGSGSFTVQGYSESPVTTAWTPDPADSGTSNLEGRVTMDGVNNVAAWEAYFSNSDEFTGVTTSGDTVTATFETDRIIIREIPINVTYRSGS